MDLLGAVVWHYWIAVVLVVTMVIPLVVYVAVGYLKNVVKSRYPSRHHIQD